MVEKEGISRLVVLVYMILVNVPIDNDKSTGMCKISTLVFIMKKTVSGYCDMGTVIECFQALVA